MPDQQTTSSTTIAGTEHRATEHRATEHRATEHRATEHRATEHHATEHHATELPSVSVVMSVLNGEHSVESAIDSLAEQTHRPIEIVVVNDGSTDATAARLNAAADRHPGLLTVLDQPNRGIPTALNRAIAASSGALIANADCDDLYPPDRLRITAALMQRTDADIGGGQTLLVSESGRSVGLSRFPTTPTGIAARLAEQGDPLPHTTMMLRRSSIERFGAYRQIRRAADLEIMLRWARLGARFAVSDEAVATHALRHDHLSSTTQLRWMIQTAYAREVAQHDADQFPKFDDWLNDADLGPIRREAHLRAFRQRVRSAITRAGIDPGRIRRNRRPLSS